MDTAVTKIIPCFFDSSKVTDIKENRSGHINSTFFIICDGQKYVVQKINKYVFKNPNAVMLNIAAVTEHIRKKLAKCGGDTENGVMTFLTVRNSENRTYTAEIDGDFWRAYRYIDGDCYQTCDSPELFEKVGRAFGNFQYQLSDFNALELSESIENFHNTKHRFETFRTSLKNDAAGRAASVSDEIQFVLRRKRVCAAIVDKLADGTLSWRVTHNDTKLNNIIMNKNTGEGLCVIDLDTVMPGSMLYDFGDAIRFGASSAAEDETDLSKVEVLPEMFAAFTKGYINGLNGSATTEEILMFPDAARIITLETGIRFLTDYLDGDKYFRTEYPAHNLDRARNQFKLVSDMEAKMPKLRRIVKKYINKQ